MLSQLHQGSGGMITANRQKMSQNVNQVLNTVQLSQANFEASVRGPKESDATSYTQAPLHMERTPGVLVLHSNNQSIPEANYNPKVSDAAHYTSKPQPDALHLLDRNN